MHYSFSKAYILICRMLLNYRDKEQISDRIHKSNFFVQNIDVDGKITDHLVKNEDDPKNRATELT